MFPDYSPGFSPLPAWNVQVNAAISRRVVRQILGARWHPSDLPEGQSLVLFTADWCGYCRGFESHFKELREQWMIDISDEDDPLWDSLNIRVVPTVILFENGAPKRRWAGVLGASHFAEMKGAVTSGGSA